MRSATSSRKTVGLLLVVLASSILAGCDGPPPESTGPAATPVRIVNSTTGFDPAEITVTVGTKVRWTNDDSVGHTVTSKTGNELDSPTLLKNQFYDHTFSTVGTFEYRCVPHPQMEGKVIVVAATNGSA